MGDDDLTSSWPEEVRVGNSIGAETMVIGPPRTRLFRFSGYGVVGQGEGALHARTKEMLLESGAWNISPQV
ncbi:hypothetical protein L1987_37302 [Smallanthus sonchifolius]|uniref:Uncharacterized protein n=2 Tax=Smallanthus sonchifolius TaxID=185202 RepID=A0ACB9HFU0_9ASTR|nr:hypothetical protein L1987_37285 [Smallanthus sonchifolius]KAI3794669.1 hypothetical protein L1987_37302 [Smallanthus sonchifolius]